MIFFFLNIIIYLINKLFSFSWLNKQTDLEGQNCFHQSDAKYVHLFIGYAQTNQINELFFMTESTE